VARIEVPMPQMGESIAEGTVSKWLKGVGEAGTVGALPALLNAVNDALAPLGVRHLDMPVTPERVWRAIREAAVRKHRLVDAGKEPAGG